MKNKNLLEALNISKSFFGIKVLDNINFSIKHGEVLGLVGENGAGKSTLVKVLTGVYRQDSGIIKIEDKEKNIFNINIAKESGINIVFQELSLANNLTVSENIFVGKLPTNRLGFVESKLLHNRAQDLIKRFKVSINPRKNIGELSIGNRQIVEILKAVASKPKLLILDEPTSSLESKEISVLFDLINELKKNNYSIIYITHQIDEIMDITDNVLILFNGKNVGKYKTKEIGKNNIIKTMIGKELKEYYGGNEKKDISEDAILEVKNFTKKKLFKNISFKLYKGEILGLVGVIGSGKLEICKAIFGLIKPDKGELFFNGKKVLSNSPSEAVNNKIIFVPENRKEDGLFLRDTIKNNIIISILKKVSRLNFIINKIINKNVKYFINLLKIKARDLNQDVLYLSGGNQQKVLVSRCLAANPKILVAIDPTRGIDVGSKADIHRILKETSEKGVSIIFISSEHDEVINMSDRILGIKNGEISNSWNKEEFNNRKIIDAIH